MLKWQIESSQENFVILYEGGRREGEEEENYFVGTNSSEI
jgi:hypothetical protein